MPTKQAAYQTLYVVLVTFAKLLAPVLPFMTEAMYQNLVRQRGYEGAAESVHHCMYPHRRTAGAERRRLLVDAMAAVRQAATLGHSVRATNNLKVRQPLARP